MDKELSWSTIIMTLFYAFGLKSLVIFILNMECHTQYFSGADIPVLFMHVVYCISAFRGQGGSSAFIHQAR